MASLVQDLLKQILEIAVAEEAKAVTEVQVWLGARTQLTPTRLSEDFDCAAAGTIAEGAELEIVLSGDVNDPDAERILLHSISVDA